VPLGCPKRNSLNSLILLALLPAVGDGENNTSKVIGKKTFCSLQDDTSSRADIKKALRKFHKALANSQIF
jgi:hypothetical protein